MAYPTIRDFSYTYAVSTNTVFPTTVVAGDTLVFIATTVSSTPSSGWTLISDAVIDSNFGTFVQAKIADGTEGGTTVASGFTHYGSVVLAIPAGGELPDAATSAVIAAADTPNPPSLTASNTTDNLWLAYGYCSTSANFSTPTPPSGFTPLFGISGLAVAYLNEYGLTKDPGAFGDADANTGNMYGATISISLYTPPTSNNLFFGSNF